MFRSTSAALYRVGVLGAAGGIGQPLSLLLKNNPLVSELRLYDIAGAPGVAADLSHVCAPAKVIGYNEDELEAAVTKMDIVLIAAGVPRRPGMTRDDLFSTNTQIIRDLSVAIGNNSPKALIGIICNPVNSIVPVAVETLRKLGVYDPTRMFGITTLDSVRARTCVAEALKISPYDVDVPVIGGHSGDTIVPLLSRYSPKLSEEQIKALTHRIQYAGDEVVKAKAGSGSATLSMAYAASEFTTSLLKALRGDKGIVEHAMVESTLHQPVCRFFSSAFELGPRGIENVLPMPELSPYEQQLLDTCLPKFREDQSRGITYGVQTHLTPDN